MSIKIPSTTKPSSKPDPTKRRHILKRVSNEFGTHIFGIALNEVVEKGSVPLKDVIKHIENRILAYAKGVCKDNLLVRRDQNGYFALYVGREETVEEYNKRQASLQARRAKAALTKEKKAKEKEKKAKDAELAKAEAAARQLAADKAAFSKLAKKLNVQIPSNL